MLLDLKKSRSRKLPMKLRAEWPKRRLRNLAEQEPDNRFIVQVRRVSSELTSLNGKNQAHNRDRSRNDRHSEMFATVSRSSCTVNSDPDVVLHIYGFIILWLCIPCVIHAELSDFFPGGNEWFKVANVSIWTIILKTKTQNEMKNAELQNVLHFERLKECCWEIPVIISICQTFCNRLRRCKFAQ